LTIAGNVAMFQMKPFPAEGHDIKYPNLERNCMIAAWVLALVALAFAFIISLHEII
jgi:hypothetical protein